MSQFWQGVIEWCIGFGSFMSAVIVIVVFCIISSATFQQNWRDRQVHKRALQRMKFKAELARKGTPSEYIDFLEKEAFKDNG